MCMDGYFAGIGSWASRRLSWIPVFDFEGESLLSRKRMNGLIRLCIFWMELEVLPAY